MDEPKRKGGFHPCLSLCCASDTLYNQSRLRSIAAHRDHCVRRLSVHPSVYPCVCLSDRHTFLVVTHRHMHSLEYCHYVSIYSCIVSNFQAPVTLWCREVQASRRTSCGHTPTTLFTSGLLAPRGPVASPTPSSYRH